MASKEWWKTFFGGHYIREWELAGVFKYTKQEVNFLERVVPLRKSDSILDLCCGHGRHAIELARRGYKVTGLDFSSCELGLAKKEVERKGLAVHFVRGDARNFKFRKKFDVIINMFTAFGYGTRDDDKRIIRNVSRALKKGGKFFIDIQSLPWLWRNFQPVKREKLGGMQIMNKREYDFLEGIIRNTHIVRKGRLKRVFNTQTRNYTLAELRNLLEEEGLKVARTFGSYRGDPFGFNFKRMLVVAKKV